MASAVKFSLSESTEGKVLSILADKLRSRQQNIAEITEMIHVSIVAILQSHTLLFCFSFLNLLCLQVASLMHDDVLDNADTRCGVRSLNLIKGNKVFTRAV
jgi:geranyl diphosphate synthase